jgi:hypothetical protein
MTKRKLAPTLDLGLLRQINADRALASLLLFAHRHPQEEAPMHIEMMDLLRAQDEFIVLEAFREAGKTTKAEEHMILAGCFGNYQYMLVIGETYEKACQRLASIDHECTTNVKLQHIFGGKVLARKSIENRMWFKSGTFIQALGWEQELQSFKHREHRPDFAFLDDVENQERVRDSAAVQESMEKLYRDLIPAMDKEHRKIVVSQTRRAEVCMVTKLAANDEWLYRGYPICNGDIDDPATVATWPQRYPMEWIRAERARFQHSGMLGAFLQSYMLQAIDVAAKPFKDSMLAELDLSPYHWMPRFAIYDPSRSTRERRNKGERKSDRTGKVVVSRLGSKILIHESSGNYWAPNQLIDDLFLVNEQHHPAAIAVEKNSLDDWLLQPIRIEMLKRGTILPLKVLQAPQDRNKEEFILGLQPFAQANDVVLIGGRSAHPQLVAEWANFPSGPRDVLNALAYALRMFGGIPMYEDFSGANIGDAPRAAQGEDVFIGLSATPSEVVAVAVLRDGRRLTVAADWSASGALADALKTLVFECRAAYPLAALQAWVPADVYDQWQRVPLVPALRGEHLVPYRAEHNAVARGCLAERMRTTWHGKRLLLVDRNARLTLNALSTGYALPSEKGGRTGSEPEPGVSRLLAEALECMVAVLDRSELAADGFPRGANVGVTPSGREYVTANPRARA